MKGLSIKQEGDTGILTSNLASHNWHVGCYGKYMSSCDRNAEMHMHSEGGRLIAAKISVQMNVVQTTAILLQGWNGHGGGNNNNHDCRDPPMHDRR